MTDHEEKDAKSKVQASVFVSWIIGCCIIFAVASVTYRYFGVEGESWFQVHGILVAIIIAHYSRRMFKFSSEPENDIQK